MIPGNDEKLGGEQKEGSRGRWFTPIRCSICTRAIWFSPIMLTEPIEAPEPHYDWILCKSCHKALLVEVRRSPLRPPMRLRVAIGLVAAERFPQISSRRTHAAEQMEFQREFSWVIRLMVLFALMHLIIFVIILTIPK